MTARVLLAVVSAVAISGCGVSNPANRPPSPPPGMRAPTALRTPAAGIDAQHDSRMRVAVDFTLTQATWSPDTYVSQQAHLARLATGRALTQLAPRDGQPPAAIVAQLRAAHASSRASLIGTDGPDQDHRVVVAYKTLATGTGRQRGRASYAIAQLTLTRVRGHWLVSTFAIGP